MPTKAQLQEELKVLQMVNADLIRAEDNDKALVANGDKEPDFHTMNVYERVYWMRAQRDYIKKKITSEGTAFDSAVAHTDLIKLVRPLFETARLIWWPITSSLVATNIVEMKNGPAIHGEYHWTYRVQSIDLQADFMDLQIHSTGWSWRGDGFDKGPGKASTYSDKYFLLRLLGLESGDDPDFTDTGLETTTDASSTVKIKTIRSMLQAESELEGGMEWHKAEAQAVAAIARKKSRVNVKNIYGLPEDMLDEWLEVLHQRAKIRADSQTKGLG